MRMIMIIVIIVYLVKASLYFLIAGCLSLSLTTQMSNSDRKNASLSWIRKGSQNGSEYVIMTPDLLGLESHLNGG